MSKAQMRDIVVVLPGITGSVLRQKNGSKWQDVWAFSGPVIWSAITNLNGVLNRLQVSTPDPNPAQLESTPNLDDLGDGIEATGLMPDLHLIPGFWKIDGYNEMRDLILKNFNVTEGQNYFEFPYDWRRDNRIAAHRLKRLLDVKLSAWRASSGAKDAKVILIGHSMGGLVSRYYLECLDGWRNCRALVTFGTPHRGSVKALDVLSNGLKVLSADLSPLVKSCMSVHQLLPTFRVVRAINGLGHKDYRLGEPGLSVPNLDAARVTAGLGFHAEIDANVQAHLQNAQYVKAMKIVPIVGTRQPTLVSAVLDAGSLTTSEAMLDDAQATLVGGDGTVPRISAIPLERWDELGEVYVEGKHASLQALDVSLEQVLNLLLKLQNLPVPARGGKLRAQPGWVSLYADDLYMSGEPAILRARAFAQDGSPKPLRLEAKLKGAAKGAKLTRVSFTGDLGDWQVLRLEGLERGAYRVEVCTQSGSGGRVRSVQDVFEVA